VRTGSGLKRCHTCTHRSLLLSSPSVRSDPASHRHGHRRPPPHRTGPQSDVPACASRAAPAKAAAQRGAACATAAAAGQGPEPALLHVCADQAERQLIQPSARMAGTAAARLFAVPEGFASVLAWHCRSSTDTGDGGPRRCVWARSGHCLAVPLACAADVPSMRQPCRCSAAHDPSSCAAAAARHTQPYPTHPPPDCDDLDFASWRCSGASSAAASVDCSH
jgi:hypothetical protein